MVKKAPKTPAEFAEKQDLACKSLWANVILQALEDIKGRPYVGAGDVTKYLGVSWSKYSKASKEEKAALRDGVRAEMARDALDFFNDTSWEKGSFRWICRALGYRHENLKIGAISLNSKRGKGFATGTGGHIWHVEEGNSRVSSEEGRSLDALEQHARENKDSEFEGMTIGSLLASLR
jgi:hypothetical protein